MEVRPRKGNEASLQCAEMRMFRWICDVKVKEFQVELREIRNR